LVENLAAKLLIKYRLWFEVSACDLWFVLVIYELLQVTGYHKRCVVKNRSSLKLLSVLDLMRF